MPQLSPDEGAFSPKLYHDGKKYARVRRRTLSVRLTVFFLSAVLLMLYLRHRIPMSQYRNDPFELPDMEASLNDQDRPSLPHPLETDSRTTDLSDSGDYPRHLPWIRPAPEVEHEKVHNLGPYTQVDDSIPMQVWDHLPVRGAFYMVVRKENLVQARMTLRNLEDRFNRHKRYPIIVLGNQYYSDKFRKYLSKATESPIYFGKIDPLVWDYPGWIDISQAEESMQFMSIYRIPNGDSLAFRQTSRYHAGFFFHHPLFANVQYTWRIEPGSVYTCEMETDPFQYMYDHKKVLGFTQSQKEHQDTMLSLWLFTMEFMKKSSDLVLPRNETIMPWMVDESNHYNRCVLLSQFQIVDLSFLRSTAYQKYFAFLDRKGGFFYERWSEAPVITMAAAMFLKKAEIQFFNSIGYMYGDVSHCPFSLNTYQQCMCDIRSSFDFHTASCTPSLLDYLDDDESMYEITDFLRYLFLDPALAHAEHIEPLSD